MVRNGKLTIEDIHIEPDDPILRFDNPFTEYYDKDGNIQAIFVGPESRNDAIGFGLMQREHSSGKLAFIIREGSGDLETF